MLLSSCLSFFSAHPHTFSSLVGCEHMQRCTHEPEQNLRVQVWRILRPMRKHGNPLSAVFSACYRTMEQPLPRWAAQKAQKQRGSKRSYLARQQEMKKKKCRPTFRQRVRFGSSAFAGKRAAGRARVLYAQGQPTHRSTTEWAQGKPQSFHWMS